MKLRILSISYDPSLLATREMLLASAGYHVVSTSPKGFADAMEHCGGNFDLVIVGHSIPQEDKRAIVAELHRHGCDAPLLSLLRDGEDPIPEATRAIELSSPQLLLDTVHSMLKPDAAKTA
jgi:DNA-binding response OmpR family regulator